MGKHTGDVRNIGESMASSRSLLSLLFHGKSLFSRQRHKQKCSLAARTREKV